MANNAGFDLTNSFPGSEDAVPDRPLPPLPAEWTSLGAAFVQSALAAPDTLFAADSKGTRISYGEALKQAVGLARLLSGRLDEAQCVGILMPPLAATAVVNIAVTLAGKVPVNLNYTNQTVTDSAVRQCGITAVVASSEAMRSIKVQPQCRMIYVEEMAASAATASGDGQAQRADLPAILRSLPGMQAGLDDLATVLFSTGSTGDHKGIMLSHRNILANAHAIANHAQLEEREVILGILPFFHSFGFTVTFWTMAVLGKSSVYHYNPIDPREVGRLLVEHQVTLMACTPTLMRHYLKRCTKEQFSSVRWLLLGSEKLKAELARDCQDKLGITPVEGYGLTELGPLCAANVPMMVATPDGRQVFGNKLGSVGQPSPGTTVRIVSLETGKILPPGQANQGLIFVHGPQVMMGYLNRPDATAAVVQNGWLCTGDVGYVDEDGFLFITDRLARFAKIAGEMVPLVNVESALRTAAGVTEEKVSVVAVPDAERGERLIVLYASLGDLSPADVVGALNATDMSKLWIPKAGDFFQIGELPVSDTGKLDLKECKRIAIERVSQRDGQS